MNKIKILNPVITAALFIFALAYPLPAAADTMHEVLRGAAFTDPSYSFPMSQEWIRKPITHDKTVQEADLVVSLDQGGYPFLLPFIQQYSREHGLNIAVREGTCGISAGALVGKSIDIGGFCCPPGKDDRLPGLRFHTLGIVGIAFIVNPGNPVEGLSRGQLEDVFTGNTYRWSELKTPEGKTGPHWKIRAIGRLHCQARPGHWRLLLKDSEEFSPRLYEVGSIPDMIARVAKHRDAIGWEVLGLLEKYKSLGSVKPLRIDGLLPSDTGALAAGRYHFYRTYNVTTWEGPGVENANAKGLVEYLIKATEHIDPRYGFVPASRLKKAGWKFKEDELIGEPG